MIGTVHVFRAMQIASVISWVFAESAYAASVSGVVTNAGIPVAGARVTLFTLDLNTFVEQRTLADGSYQISIANSGPYQLGVESLNFAYQQILVDLRAAPQVKNFALTPETSAGAWAIIGNTLPEFFDATDIGILMNDGTVFFCHDTVDPIRFDPVTGLKSFPTGSMSEQGCMNAGLREDGRIMMVGGQSPSDPGSFGNAVPWVKAYSPSTNTWAQLPNLQLAAGRWYPGMARLSDGSFLAMGGGMAPNAQRTPTCERFNLTTQAWTFTGSMLNPTEFPPSALLYTGKVLATWSPPQLYDPTTGQWTATGNFVQSNRGWPNHSDHSLCLLSDGRALAIGIRRANTTNNTMGEIYDPATGIWSLTSNPGLVRMQSEVVQLPDGRIFVGAGETEVSPPPVPTTLGVVKWCDLYDPSANTWRRMADLNWFREYHAVTLLVPDGRVITTGGTRIKFQVGPTSADIEAFSPPYMFRGVRPQVTSISTTTPRRGAVVSLTIAPQTRLTSVVLVGSPITTHWVDAGNQRRLVLPVSQQGSIATVMLPIDGNLLPLGHYMMFAMVDDIPSVAKIIRVRPRSGDVNGNGIVNVDDLVTVITAWGPCPAPCPPVCAADLNDDCVVNVDDLVAVITNWG